MTITSRLQPRLGLFSTTSIVVGTMIGSGIFRKTAPMAALLGSSELVIAVWIAAGLITLCGALTVAEVTAMMPQSGGQYRYYRIMYGDAVAFLSGWSIFSVIQTGSIAAIAFVFSEYANSITPLLRLPDDAVARYSFHLPVLGEISVLDALGVKILTCTLILVVTLVNVRGVTFGGGVASVLTTLKVLALLAITIAGLSAVAPVASTATTSLVIPSGWALIPAVTLAMSKAFWAYDGWGSIAYVGDEVRDAQRTLPRAIIFGVVLVIFAYLSINLSYLHALSLHDIAASNLVAADVMRAAVGPDGALFVALAVMVSTAGAVNGTILNSARVYYAMACDGLFFAPLRAVHDRFGTPSVSLYTQCVWSCLLVFTGTFEVLTDMLIFVGWLLYGLSAYGVFILRRTLPDAERPYKVWGYPFVPAVFVVFSLLFVLSTLGSDVYGFVNGTSGSIPSLAGLLIVLCGWPVYLVLRRHARVSA